MAKPDPTFVAVLAVQKVEYTTPDTRPVSSRNEVPVRLDPVEIARVSIHAGSIEELQSKLQGHINLITD